MKSTAGLGGEQVEGRHAVTELLRAGSRRVHQLYLAGRTAEDEALLDLARQAGASVTVVSETELQRMARSEVPQGVLARAAGIEPVPLSGLAAAGTAESPPFLVVLDQIYDPHNLGSILRSASGAGVSGIVLARHRAAQLTPAACKAAAGAVEHLRFCLVGGIPAALAELARARVWSVGLDAGAGTDLEQVAVLVEPLALVLGSEGRGLAPLTRQRCDVLARIPLVGTLESLNVSAAAAIACFTAARHRAASRRR